VFLPFIPVDMGEYENNPELLTVQIASHMEKTLVEKFIS
jgi:hypothetical protein